MTIKSFLKLVEIPTKIASVFPFVLGTLYTIYYFDSFNFINMCLMFTSLLLFDMATTGLNNYMDYKKAIKTNGFNYESHNAIVAHDLKESTVKYTLLFLISIASLLGILLFLRTSFIVLCLGVLSFVIGILYSYGPVPISRLPLGELFSGLFMGLLIPIISILIHIPDLITFEFNLTACSLNVFWPELGRIILISIVPICSIANIMLANNICDMDDDLINKRYTLPIFIGKPKALIIFRQLYFMCYPAIIISVFLGALPVICLLMLITLPVIYQNINHFVAKQSKEDTFVYAIKNFIILNGFYVICLILGIIINHLI